MVEIEKTVTKIWARSVLPDDVNRKTAIFVVVIMVYKHIVGTGVLVMDVLASLLGYHRVRDSPYEQFGGCEERINPGKCI